MEKSDEFYNNFIESFEKIIKEPKKFIKASDEVCSGLKTELKHTYDFSKSEEIKSIKSGALPQLIIEGLDLEQIWQQIELQNEPLMTRALINVSKLVVGKNKLVFNNLITQNEVEQKLSDEGAGDEDVEDASEASLLDENEELDENESDLSENETAPLEKPTNKGKASIVDDDFFKMDEMEQFLNAEEKKLNDPDSGNNSEESESEESVDLFDGAGFEEDDEEDTMVTAKYNDFFVAKEESKGIKRNKFLEDMGDSEEEEEEPKSAFELRQERLKDKIEEIEEGAIGEKPWQLKGEVTGEKRPHNSLLQEVVDFDLTTRPAPVITEQTSMQLEDIIRERIKNKVFDSVQRKVKPAETPLEYKKKLVLDQEKSKESLAQIYEKEYLNQKAALDPENAEKEEEEPQLHKEITALATSLFQKLDALSNFHFTPKPAVPELRIISNLPSIHMEEVAPVAASDATLLAPEEVKHKRKGETMGKSERSRTDKNRERRKKKKKQHVHAKKAEDATKAKSELGAKFSKVDSKKLANQVVKQRNVKKMDESEGSKGVKSSTAFFSLLQEEVKTQIKSKAANKRKKNAKTLDAKKMKL